MSDENEMAPLKRAYLSALAARGREPADRVIQRYAAGARGAHAWRKVAAKDVAKAIADLEQLTFKGDAGVAKTESRLQRMANAAYGRGDKPKPPRDLDATAIFRRWNQPPARTLNDQS